MSDPRNDPRLSDPGMRRPDTSGGIWGWIAGIAVLVLIAIILIAGWNNSKNTASTAPASTTGSGTAPVTTSSAPAAHPAPPTIPAKPAPKQ